ncbi:MAG: hemX [Gammaproteobacteria bacterium]|jgi:uroporphyrin-3 C-methyltransferase|nr:hemX [Gammaproteobacteria bacterium]
MSNERKDEIIEKTPANPAASRRFPWRTLGIFCTAVSVIVLIVVGIYSGDYLIRFNKKLAVSAMQSQEKLHQLQSDISTIRKETDAAQEKMGQLSENIKNLKTTVEALSQINQDNQSWRVNEAHYYAKLANDTLQFSHNISLAVTLLKKAEQGISGMTDPKWLEVRKVIAMDIAALQSTPQLDVAELYIKLTVLNNQLDKLPLLAKQTNLPEQKSVEVEPTQTWWQRGLHASWRALENIVIVRYQSNGPLPLMVPEQQIFLFQNLHAMLAQAMWALLHQQPIIYQSSLKQVNAWIIRYFVLEASLTQALLSELSQLEKIDINPPIPDIKNTLQAFNGV